MLAVLIMRSDL